MLEGKVAIVTGSASGIGRATKELLIRNKVEVISVDMQKVSKTSEQYILDVSKEDEVKAFYKQIEQKHEKVDFLINCAGIFCSGGRAYVENVTVQELMKVFEVNFIGSFLMLKYAIPFLRKSECPAVVNLSSDQTFHPQKNNLAYLVSKNSINSLTQLAAKELMQDKIRVNAVAAASVRTNFIKSVFGKEKMEKIYQREDEAMPFGLIEPEAVASMITYLLSDAAKNITGQVLLIDSGKTL